MTLKKSSSFHLVDALRTGQEKTSAFLGLLAIGFMFLSIFLFGKEARFPILAFSTFFVITALFLITSIQTTGSNPWFVRFFALLNSFMVLLALAGWIWVLYLSQENPGGRYDALAELDFTVFLLFFFLITIPGIIGLLVSQLGFHRKRKAAK